MGNSQTGLHGWQQDVERGPAEASRLAEGLLNSDIHHESPLLEDIFQTLRHSDVAALPGAFWTAWAGQ